MYPKGTDRIGEIIGEQGSLERSKVTYRTSETLYSRGGVTEKTSSVYPKGTDRTDEIIYEQGSLERSKVTYRTNETFRFT